MVMVRAFGFARWGQRVAVCVAVVLLGVGCGSGAAGPSSSPVDPDPAAGDSNPPTDDGGPGPVVGPSRESAARFGAEVVGRLEQEAFWADGPGFLDPVVAGDGSVVVGLDARVDGVRWAIATFPGPTRRTWFVAAPLTVEVVEFDGSAGRAVVRVWVVSVFSREDLGPAETSFTTETADLVWDGDGGVWRVESLAVSAGPAVALSVNDVAVTPAELDAALVGHRLIGFGDVGGQ